MTLKTLAFGTMLAAATVGTTVATAPAQAATLGVGDNLELVGDSRLEIGSATAVLNFDSNPASSGTNFNNNIGRAFISNSSAAVFGRGSIATLKDLNLTGSGTTFSLASGVTDFITLTNGIKFNLETFLLRRTGTGPSGFSSWVADYTGTFVADSDDLPGFGIFTTQGRVTTTGGSSFSNSTVAIPTPALLPGLIGMGVAALRKRKSEEAAEVAEAAETVKA